MSATEPCDCPGCVYEDGACYYPQGLTGAAPWSPDTLDPVELPPRVVGLIESVTAEIPPTQPDVG